MQGWPRTGSDLAEWLDGRLARRLKASPGRMARRL